MEYRHKIKVALCFCVASCVPDQSKEASNEIVGAWYTHEPIYFGPEKSLHIGFICFSKNGEYNSFELSSLDTLRATKLTSATRIIGSWILHDDTLILKEKSQGHIYDSIWIGNDWVHKMRLKKNEKETKYRVRFKKDSAYIYGENGSNSSIKRKEPSEEIKNICKE
jgi:hypothetical protein